MSPPVENTTERIVAIADRNPFPAVKAGQVNILREHIGTRKVVTDIIKLLRGGNLNRGRIGRAYGREEAAVLRQCLEDRQVFLKLRRHRLQIAGDRLRLQFGGQRFYFSGFQTGRRCRQVADDCLGLRVDCPDRIAIAARVGKYSAEAERRKRRNHHHCKKKT
jgi:hypothetical protein